MRSKLIQARLKKGYTQEQIAYSLGTTRSCYSNYESGIRQPSIQKIIKLKKILNDTNDEIFLNDDDTLSIEKA